MNKTFVFQLICAFSAPEVRRARQFLSSPYHNQREDVRWVFDFLAECRHDLGIEPTREQVFAKVYPGAAFDDQKLRLLLSYLLRLLESFLELEELGKDEVAGSSLLLAAYRRRRLDRHFHKAMRRTRRLLDNGGQRHPEYHFQAYLLEQEQYQLLSTTGRTRDLNLQSLGDELNRAFLSMKLRHVCLALSHQSVYKTEYDLPLIREVMEEAGQERYAGAPAVRVYFLGARSLLHPEHDGYFREFRKELLAAFEHFPRSDVRDLLLLALNFCIRRINEGQEGYLREALELYRRGIEATLLLEGGKLSRFTFNNIVGIGLRLEELDWVENFMQQYRDALPAAYREVTFRLNAARLAYARRDFDRALRDLQRADYSDLINNMVAKTLQLKIYYENEEFDLLEAHLRTMRAYLRRQRRMSYHQRNYLNIVRFTQKLITTNPFDREARAKLKEEIKHTEPLTEKEWLLAQL